MAENDRTLSPAHGHPDGPIGGGLVQRAEGEGITQVAGDLTQNFVANVTVEPPKAPKPVYLARVLRALADSIDDPPRNAATLIPYDVEEKILHNQVVSYRRYIEEFSAYFHAVEGAYDSLAKAAYPRDRVVIKRHLREEYLNLSGQQPLAAGDEILQLLISDLKKIAHTMEDVPVEEIGPCCGMIVAHAFVECTVLRNPNDAR